MKEKKIDLFVPGRLCIMGEHSDWAGRYRTINNEIEKGYRLLLVSKRVSMHEHIILIN